jgi:hypothetical protein
MQSWYISGSNVFTIRTAQTGSSDLTLSLEDMLTLSTSSVAISDYTFDTEQQILQFTASLTASVGDEFRAYITDSCNNTLWNGTIQVYASQSIDKPAYINQNTSGSFISNDTANEYIILT